MSLWIKALLIAAAIAALFALKGAYDSHEQKIGEDRVQAKWDQWKLKQQEADAAAEERNAEETKQRFRAQERNQEKQNEELQAARADADRARDVAARVQHAADTAAEQWGHTLAHSPTNADLEAAAAAIRVCSNLLGQSRGRSLVLAGFADAARAAGLKCERDYDALTSSQPKEKQP